MNNEIEKYYLSLKSQLAAAVLPEVIKRAEKSTAVKTNVRLAWSYADSMVGELKKREDRDVG